MTNARTVRALFSLLGFALAAACGSDDTGTEKTPEEPQGGSPAAGTGGSAAMSSTPSGGAGFAVEGQPWAEEGTAGVGLVSGVFGDPLNIGTSPVEPVDCTHPAPGTCDWARVDEGCCSDYQCIHATTDPDDSWPIQACQALVDCIRTENPGCSIATDPLCAARNGSETSVCTEPYETGGTTDEGSASAFVRAAITCVCGY